MGSKPDATPVERDVDWRSIDFQRAERTVKRLQGRIVKAVEEGKWRKVKNLMRLLVRSYSGRALAVLRVTTSRGRNTPGVDKETWKTQRRKGQAVKELNHRGYKSRPLRRVYIPKKGGGLRNSVFVMYL